MTLKEEGHRVRITHFIYLIGIFVVVLREPASHKKPAPTWAVPIRSVVLHDKKRGAKRIREGQKTGFKRILHLVPFLVVKKQNGTEEIGDGVNGVGFFTDIVYTMGKGMQGAGRGCKLYIAGMWFVG